MRLARSVIYCLDTNRTIAADSLTASRNGRTICMGLPVVPVVKQAPADVTLEHHKAPALFNGRWTTSTRSRGESIDGVRTVRSHGPRCGRTSYYTRSGDHQRMVEPPQETNSTLLMFLKEWLLMRCPEPDAPQQFAITQRGLAYCESLCAMGLPEAYWEVPTFQKLGRRPFRVWGVRENL